ncbi:hypothetical protein VYU27_005220 [Nannochloropsis oceanica]
MAPHRQKAMHLPNGALVLLVGAALFCCCCCCCQAYVPSPLFGPKRRSHPLPALRHAARPIARIAPFPPLRSTFSSFFSERTGSNNSSSASNDNLSYELRLLELEGRLLKLEGLTARAAKAGGGGGGGGGRGRAGGNVKGATGMGTSAFNHILPDGEQLLLGCTFAGAVLGLFVGRALLNKQMYLGGVGGAVLGVHFFNQDGNFGAAIRAMGKLVLYACDRLAYAWSEVKFNWKAWRVYERSFKKLESLDREMQVSQKIKAWDQQYGVSNNVNVWFKKFQTSAKNLEESLKDQAIYWQRTQRLRDEQRQAQMIHQEVQRQQERERMRQNGGGVGGGSFKSGSGGIAEEGREQQQQQEKKGGGEGFHAAGDHENRIKAGGFWPSHNDETSSSSTSTPSVAPRPSSYSSRVSSSPSSFSSSSSSLDATGAIGNGGSINGLQGRSGRLPSSSPSPSSSSSPTIASEFNRFVKSFGGTTSGVSRSTHSPSSSRTSSASNVNTQIHGHQASNHQQQEEQQQQGFNKGGNDIFTSSSGGGKKGGREEQDDSGGEVGMFM